MNIKNLDLSAPNKEFKDLLDKLTIGTNTEKNDLTRVAKVVIIAEVISIKMKNKKAYLDAVTVGRTLIFGLNNPQNDSTYPICPCQATEILGIEDGDIDNFNTAEAREILREAIEVMSIWHSDQEKAV